MSLTGFKPSYCLHLFQQRPPIYGSPDMLHEMVFPGNWRFVAALCWANLLVPIFPTAFAHFMFLLSHVGNSCSVSNFFIIICYGDLWSVIFDAVTIVKNYNFLKVQMMVSIFSNKMSFSSVQFSRSVVSDSLRPHELQHTRPPCPSPTSGV